MGVVYHNLQTERPNHLYPSFMCSGPRPHPLHIHSKTTKRKQINNDFAAKIRGKEVTAPPLIGFWYGNIGGKFFGSFYMRLFYSNY